MANNDFFIGATLLQRDSSTNLRKPMTLLAQTGVGSAGGEPTSTTSWAAFDLTDVTSPGQGWMLNLGTNDVSLSLEITTVTEGTVNYPFGIAKPGIAIPFYWDPEVKTNTPLQHKTASGTSVIQWRIWQV